jgi:hypothetical protein
MVACHSSDNPSTTVFENIETLPKGTLLSLAQAHGLKIEADRCSCEHMRAAIVQHLSNGHCASREGLASHLACASLANQFEELLEGAGESEDPSTLLQIYLLRQIMPILKLKPLRRLLEMHDVTYIDSDKVKQLRQHLKKFLNRLQNGKRSDDTLGLLELHEGPEQKKVHVYVLSGLK